MGSAPYLGISAYQHAQNVQTHHHSAYHTISSSRSCALLQTSSVHDRSCDCEKQTNKSAISTELVDSVPLAGDGAGAYACADAPDPPPQRVSRVGQMLCCDLLAHVLPPPDCCLERRVCAHFPSSAMFACILRLAYCQMSQLFLASPLCSLFRLCRASG
jgi:hypothetical protein